VLQTRSALVAYSSGLIGLILVKILAPGFYARQDIKTPVRIALISLAATQLMNFAFIGWLRHAGLALSIGLASCLNAALLWRGLLSSGTYRPQPGWPRFVAKIVFALAVMGLVIGFLSGPDALWLTSSTGSRLTRLAVVVIGGGFTYLATLFVLGFRIADFHQRTS
jgi:putative peptidoglycan lipid II flippase